MTKEEIDTMWQKAMQESIKDGEMFTRYHFAQLVTEKAFKGKHMTPQQIDAMKLALEALEDAQTNDDGMEKWDRNKKAITAIEEALAQPEQDTESHYKGVIEDVQKLFYNKREAQPEQEPVAWEQFYTTSPKENT